LRLVVLGSESTVFLTVDSQSGADFAAIGQRRAQKLRIVRTRLPGLSGLPHKATYQQSYPQNQCATTTPTCDMANVPGTTQAFPSFSVGFTQPSKT
jgi:hypothetical protein